MHKYTYKAHKKTRNCAGSIAPDAPGMGEVIRCCIMS